MMAIKFEPTGGTIVVCDFKGSIHPEINKRRPVIVLPTASKRSHLVTIIPLSTAIPKEIADWHCFIKTHLPKPYNVNSFAIAKCDLVTSVSFDRLNLFFNGKDDTGKRNYILPKITNEELEEVKRGVQNFLNLD